jgi:glycosyltransferase involved in cell wall biosynthesis
MISLCLITKNEEKWLHEFLEDLRPIVNEIILCDTGSTDRTKEIAASMGAQVVDIPWEDDFSKARNQSLSLATQPWILVLDPDIRIAKKDMLRILDLTKNPEALSYEFVMRNYVRNPNLRDYTPCRGEFIDEEKGLPGYFEDTRVALFRNHAQIKFEGVVHETVLNSVKNNILASDIVLHHYGLLPEMIDSRDKRSQYQKLSKRKVELEPLNWRAHLELGMEYMSSQEFESARLAFTKANELKPKDAFILKRLLNAESRSGHTTEAIITAYQLIECEPENHDALLTISADHILKGDFALAEQTLLKLITLYPTSDKGRMNLAILYSQQKRPSDSFALLQKMTEQNWNDAPALKLTFEMALYADLFKEAEKYIRRYLELSPQDLYAQGHLSTALMYQGKLAECLTEVNAVLKRDPHHYLANFNAGVIYFEQANWPAATKYLESALKAKPNDAFIIKALGQIDKEMTAH